MQKARGENPFVRAETDSKEFNVAQERTLTIAYGEKLVYFEDPETGREMCKKVPSGGRRVVTVSPLCDLSPSRIAYNYGGIIVDETPFPVQKQSDGKT